MSLARLNGWRRLWLVLSVLWGAWVILYSIPKIPTQESQLRVWADFVAFDVVYRNPDRPYLNQKKTSDDIRNAHRNLSDKEFIEMAPKIYPNVDFSSTLASYRQDMEGLTKYQLSGIGTAALAVFLVPALVYGFGLVIAWILAGFRKT